MKELQERHNQINTLEDDLRTFLGFVLPANWKELTLSMRKAWFHDESVRLNHYRMNSHQGDFWRNEFNTYDFCTEYLGMESSNGGNFIKVLI